MPQFVVTGTTAANPNPLSAVVKNCRMFMIIGRHKLDGLDDTGINTGKVTLGHDSTAGSGVQPILFNPTDERVWNAPAGQGFDLNRWYFNVATNGDGLVVVYE